jgi:hypothetical protein
MKESLDNQMPDYGGLAAGVNSDALFRINGEYNDFVRRFLGAMGPLPGRLQCGFFYPVKHLIDSPVAGDW